MKTISLKLPDGMHQQLERAAKKAGGSKSDLVRAALVQYLSGDQVNGRESFLAAARKWIGCVEGPGDLSTNPKYMDGFGK